MNPEQLHRLNQAYDIKRPRLSGTPVRRTKLTKQEVEDAPMFSVWGDLRGKVECQDRNTDWWNLFATDSCANEEVEKTFKLYASLKLYSDGNGLFAVMRDDEMVLYHKASNEFDDLDAALCALELGLTLVKLPDKMGSKHWRMYVAGPVPEPWASHDCFKT